MISVVQRRSFCTNSVEIVAKIYTILKAKITVVMILSKTIKIFYEFLFGTGMKEAIDKLIITIMIILIQVLIQSKILPRKTVIIAHIYTGTRTHE